MTEKLKPMDVYAEMDVPFAIAAFCRQFRLTMAAIKLTQALNARTEARKRLQNAEKLMSDAESDVVFAIQQAQKKMEEKDGN